MDSKFYLTVELLLSRHKGDSARDCKCCRPNEECDTWYLAEFIRRGGE